MVPLTAKFLKRLCVFEAEIVPMACEIKVTVIEKVHLKNLMQNVITTFCVILKVLQWFHLVNYLSHSLTTACKSEQQ